MKMPPLVNTPSGAFLAATDSGNMAPTSSALPMTSARNLRFMVLPWATPTLRPSLGTVSTTVADDGHLLLGRDAPVRRVRGPPDPQGPGLDGSYGVVGTSTTSWEP